VWSHDRVDDAARTTWAGAFLTLGLTMTLGFVLRWMVWEDAGGVSGHPQVLWTLGSLALAMLLVAAQLYAPVWWRRQEAARAEAGRREAGGNDRVEK
jgi:hypothetical protein